MLTMPTTSKMPTTPTMPKMPTTPTILTMPSLLTTLRLSRAIGLGEYYLHSYKNIVKFVNIKEV
jgi:hypothetical protein